jgi:hypothetical protein
MGENESGHHIRFYIVMITLIVGGIFFFWYLSSSDSSGLVGAFSGNSEDIIIDQNDIYASGSSGDNSYTNAYSAKTISSNTKVSKELTGSGTVQKLDFNILFSQVPVFNREVAFGKINLDFDDFNTLIKVNGGKLELSNLEKATLSVEGFVGKMGFDAGSISLSGKANRVEVNNIALSSSNEITLVFDGLTYQSFNINNIWLKELNLPIGSGKLEVADKLSYNLEEDGIIIYSFKGQLGADKSSDSMFTLNGGALGIETKGGLMSLVLK